MTHSLQPAEQFEALHEEAISILARHGLDRRGGLPVSIRFACTFPAQNAAFALDWLRALPKPFDEQWLRQPLTNGQPTSS